jgi:S-adenosyl-L-methionine hydrolase (adenosine-forming)
MSDSGRIVTLLTDFGLRDHFVAAMKGVMLSLNPNLTLVDITHDIPAQDIHSAAFTLSQAYSCFPPGTIHLAVVDPGVGSARKALAVSAGTHFFVAPDNGILSYVHKSQEDFAAYEITADHYFRKPVSSTFHGRDVFAPIAGYISRDIPLRQLGPALPKPVQLKIPVPTKMREDLIQAAVLAVDHFGNLITNLMPGDLPVFDPANPHTVKMLAGQKEITAFHRTYSEGRPGEIFVVPGSTGYLEIVMKEGSAASALNLKSGAPIGVILSR